MRERTIKRIFSGMLACVIAIGGFAVTTKQADATNDDVITYEVWSNYNDFQTKITNHTAPVKEGYLFGGWYDYDSSTGKGTVIESINDVTNEDTVAAKFIRVDMSRVACQLNLDKKNGKRDMRIVSLIDSTNYKAVGFNVYGRENDAAVNEEWVMYSYDSDRKAQSTTVYSGLNVYSDATTYETKTPADVFGSDANGFKFTTMQLSGIPEADYVTIVAIKPYWITKDGTYVEGMGEFNRVNDYNDEIVNVSVNLKEATDIGAGLLQISYSEADFEYIGADFGRIFEEMEISNTANGTIRCVGNVLDATKNAETPNDVFVNLRFKKTSSNALSAGSALFSITIPDKSFCTIDEEYVSVKAPAIKY